MLMGEFDFTTNFIKDTETPELAKVYFRYFSHINGTNSSIKGVLPDLHLIDGLGVHEPATWVGCIGYC